MIKKRSLQTTLSLEEIKSQFSIKFCFARELILSNASDYLQDDDIELHEILLHMDLRESSEIANEVFKNIIEYLIEFNIIFTEFDIFKILQELQICLIKKINEDNKIEKKNKENITKSLYLIIFNTYLNVLKTKSNRSLHPNNITKIIAIIEKNKFEEYYGERGLYYIFRNSMDLEIEEKYRFCRLLKKIEDFLISLFNY